MRLAHKNLFARKVNKPFIIFNKDTYYTPLLEFIKSSYSEGFISESDLKLIDVVSDLQTFDRLVEKYIKRKESE